MKKSEESKRESEISILFVCHGNICRSPAAEGTFIHLLKKKNLENDEAKFIGNLVTKSRSFLNN